MHHVKRIVSQFCSFFARFGFYSFPMMVTNLLQDAKMEK